MKRFTGKVVLVTGGSRNTGLDLVERFVREGATVWTCGSSAVRFWRGCVLWLVVLFVIFDMFPTLIDLPVAPTQP